MNSNLDQAIKSVRQPATSLKLKELWEARQSGDFLKPAGLFLQHCQVALLFLSKSKITTVLNIFCITVLLLFLGLLLAFQSSDFFGNSLKDQKLRLSIFMKDSASGQEWLDVESKARALSGFLELSKIDKKNALTELKKRFSEQPELFSGLEQDNPLPASVEIFFNLNSSHSLPDYAGQLKLLPGVEAAAYDGELVQVFSQLAKSLNKPGKFASISLILLAIFLISSTVRLSMFHQQEQIDIMSLVGASISFVQAPFVIGAALQALVACFLASLGLFAIQSFWSSFVTGNDALQALSFSLPFASFPVLLTLLIVSLGSGMIGSYLSARSLR